MASVRRESVVIYFKQQQVLQQQGQLQLLPGWRHPGPGWAGPDHCWNRREQHGELEGCNHNLWHREGSCSLQLAPSLLCKQQQLAPQQLGLLGQVQQQLPQHDGQEGWWLQPTETIKVKTNKIVFLTTYLESQSVTDVVHSLNKSIGINITVGTSGNSVSSLNKDWNITSL